MARMMQGTLATSNQPLLLTSSVEAWHEAISLPYSQNIDLLERLWNASFDDTESFSVKHAKWKEIGFQNECPASDFRGGGLLSLQCLVYMAETYPDTYKALAYKKNGPRSEYEYPFAASYIHMVFTLLDTLQLRNLHTVSRYSDGFLRAVMTQDHEDFSVMFQEMTVQAMIVLDDVWVSSSASYIDFPSVKEHVCRHMQWVVSKRWFDNASLILSEYSSLNNTYTTNNNEKKDS